MAAQIPLMNVAAASGKSTPHLALDWKFDLSAEPEVGENAASPAGAGVAANADGENYETENAEELSPHYLTSTKPSGLRNFAVRSGRNLEGS